MSEMITLEHTRAPGDVLTMTALVRDLALTYPGRYKTHVHTSYRKDIWKNNPYTVTSDRAVGKRIRLDYGPFIDFKSQNPIHFMQAFHADFERKTGVKVPLRFPKPDLHLEDTPKTIPERYWIILSGGKSDFTTKHWVYERHQEVTDVLIASGLTVVQAGSGSHKHPPLRGAINLVGKTSLRDMFHLIKHSEGVICTITMAMHVAAALDKPCVVTAGGRESWIWEGYHKDNPAFAKVDQKVKVSHRFLHTMGLLPCCMSKACWRNKVTRKEQDSRKSYCELPVKVGNQQVPKCMDMITAEKVVEAVFSYYADGTLPPVKGMPVKPISHETEFSTPDGGLYTLSIRRTKDPVPQPIVPVVVEVPPAPVVAPLILPRSLPDETVVIPAKPVVAPIVQVPTQPASKAWFTLFALTHGDHPAMHKRFFSALSRTINPLEVDVRIYANDLSAGGHEILNQEMKNGVINRVYTSEKNRYKYHVMRDMFRDPAAPIRTPWIIWFDDDTMCDVNPKWIDNLRQTIVEGQRRNPNLGLVGPHQLWAINKKQAEWLRAAKWYRKRQFRDRFGKPAPNGDKIHFATGSCWAMKSEVIQAADIPDERLEHNGGDVAIGEQVYQAGYDLLNWNYNRSIVHWSSQPRRGTDQGKINWIM